MSMFSMLEYDLHGLDRDLEAIYYLFYGGGGDGVPHVAILVPLYMQTIDI